MRPMSRIILAVLSAALLSLAVSACGGGGGGGGGAGGGQSAGGGSPQEAIKRDPANAGKKITVGSKNFPEQLVLGEIYSQALTAAGYKVDTKLNLGSEVVAFKALKNGDVDAYPEYTGTILTNFYKVDAKEIPKQPEAAFSQAEQKLRGDKVKAMPRTPFENTYRLGATKETAQRLAAKTTSQLAPKAKDLKITGYPECRQRLDCYVGLQRVYGTKFKEFVASEQTYEVLDQKEANIGFLFTTDADLETGKYVTFEDDKKFFPPYNVSFLVRDDTARQLGPGAQKVIEQIQKPLTNEAMIELNSRVKLDKKTPKEVATEYLKSEGFVK